MLLLHLSNSCQIYPELWPWTIWPGFYLRCCQSPPPDHIFPSGGFSSNRVTWVQPVQESDKSLDPSIIPIIIDAFLLLDIQLRVSSSGYGNVFQWNRNDSSRRVKFDSGFNVMAVYEVSWHGPKIIYRFTRIRKWVLRWQKRPFWFSKKISLTFSSNWVFPYQGACSQFLISSRKIDSSICGWKNKNSIFLLEILLLLHWVF